VSVGPETTIKMLVGGKSALENELVADLETEMGPLPEGASERTLQDLAANFPGYKGPGPVLTALTGRLVAGKLPGGLSLAGARTQLQARGLGPQRAEAALAFALTMSPAQRLPDETAASQWLQQVAAAYATVAGVQLGGPAGTGFGAAGTVQAVASSEEFLRLQRRLHALLVAYQEAGNEFMEADAYVAARQLEEALHTVAHLQADLDHLGEELDEVYRSGIRGM
jgi:3-oxoacyl-ACP reductase-like protein